MIHHGLFSDHTITQVPCLLLHGTLSRLSVFSCLCGMACLHGLPHFWYFPICGPFLSFKDGLPSWPSLFVAWPAFMTFPTSGTFLSVVLSYLLRVVCLHGLHYPLVLHGLPDVFPIYVLSSWPLPSLTFLSVVLSYLNSPLCLFSCKIGPCILVWPSWLSWLGLVF